MFRGRRDTLKRRAGRGIPSGSEGGVLASQWQAEHSQEGGPARPPARTHTATYYSQVYSSLDDWLFNDTTIIHTQFEFRY